MCEVVGEMSPSEVCATGTGIGAARALILWPELVTLGERCSRWPSWLWPLIIDGTIILATLGIVALAPYRDQLRNRGFFWVVLGIAAQSVWAATCCTPGRHNGGRWIATGTGQRAPLADCDTFRAALLALACDAKRSPGESGESERSQLVAVAGHAGSAVAIITVDGEHGGNHFAGY